MSMCCNTYVIQMSFLYNVSFNALNSKDSIQRYILRKKLPYVHCLDVRDRELFAMQYATMLHDNVQDSKRIREILDHGTIKLSQWVKMMLIIQPTLNCKYELYRRAYWGENAGRIKVQTTSPNYVVHLRTIGEHSVKRCMLFDDGHLISVDMCYYLNSAHKNVEADNEAMDSTFNCNPSRCFM